MPVRTRPPITASSETATMTLSAPARTHPSAVPEIAQPDAAGRPAALPALVLGAVLLAGLVLGLGACQTDSRQQVLASGASAVELRSYQSRAFDTTDRRQVLRTVIATLQDLAFVVDDANDMLGSVSATKLDGYALRMTVTLRPRGESQTLVRASAQYNVTAIEDPQPYQQFFDALEQSMFLAAHQVD